MEKPTAKGIINFLKQNKNLQDEFGEKLENLYLIEEKTIPQWEEEFKVDIPVGPSPADCRLVLTEIGKRYEEASRLYRKCLARRDSLYLIYTSQYDDTFFQVYSEAKEKSTRMPGKDILEKVTKSSIRDYREALDHAEIAVAFFKQMCDKLSNNRKIIEGINITLGIEAKL
jgi:hypothetical protein